MNSGQTIAAVKELYQYGNNPSLQEELDYEREYKIELTDKVDNLKNFKKNI
ncbi:MAG: hypothetical protein ACI8P3_001355 [Saprospiraceae bacterium]|jgi:hypothetical protein